MRTPEPKAKCRLGSRPASKRSGSANWAGSRLAAPCRYGLGAGRQRLAADPRSAERRRLPSWLELSKRRPSSTQLSSSPGFALQTRGARRESGVAHRPCCRSGWSWSRGPRSAGRCSSAPARRASAARRRPCRGSACRGCPGRRPAVGALGDQRRRDRPRTRQPLRCPPPAAGAPRPVRGRPGSPASSGGTGRGRPAGTPSMSQITSTGRRKAKSSTRSMRRASACCFRSTRRPPPRCAPASSPVRGRREGRGQELAHARVQRRVVEHQAGRVMAIERRADRRTWDRTRPSCRSACAGRGSRPRRRRSATGTRCRRAAA